MEIYVTSDEYRRSGLSMQTLEGHFSNGSFTGLTQVEGFGSIHAETFPTTDGGAIRRTELADAEGLRHMTLIERFRITSTGVRWETEIWTDAELPFTAPVHLDLLFDGNQWPQYWAPWADPRPDEPGPSECMEEIANANTESVINRRYSWVNPLVPRETESRRFWYGAPYFEPDNPRIGFSPFMHDLISMPLVAAFHNSADIGVTFALSPEDPLLDIVLDVTKNGMYRFTRLFYRMEAGRPVTFSADLAIHEKDWRGSVRWLAERYPKYFHSELPVAQDIAGTGAYSSQDAAIDRDRLSRMAFKVNWKASFDFPYMGMFLPDVPEDLEWMSYAKHPISIRQMRQYAADMRSNGFHVLNYFNVTEFGTDVQYPFPESHHSGFDDPEHLWKHCSHFLGRNLPEAVLLDRQGKPYFSWGNAVAMDPGEPKYQQYLLDQARRHIEQIPDSSGLCVDRLDWTRLYNYCRDDKISWLEGKACRSLQLSWQQMMKRLGALLHAHGKVLFCNNHTKRLEQLLYVDGIFDEFTYAATALNTSALLGLFKPVLGWVSHAGQVLPDYHAFFQKYLYMGVFPMAPFPGNDHALHPDPEVDEAYMDYGPMFERLRGKRWLLSPFPVQVEDELALSNVFEVPNGYAVPVVYAHRDQIRLRLRLPDLAMKDVQVDCRAMYPGSGRMIPLKFVRSENDLIVEVPVQNGCAMVIITLNQHPGSKGSDKR